MVMVVMVKTELGCGATRAALPSDIAASARTVITRARFPHRTHQVVWKLFEMGIITYLGIPFTVSK